MNSYDIIYLLSNIFGTYTIYKFINVFFDRHRKDIRCEIPSYIAYFFVIGFIYITFDIPILNLVCNLILFFLLTLNYYSGWKMRLAAVAYIYAILISVEAFTIALMSILDLNAFTNGIDLQLILSQIISKILSFIVVMLISNFKKVRKDYYIPLSHWIAIFVIPLGTLFSTYVLMTESDSIRMIQIFISIAILFMLNIFVFYLYDILLQSYQEKMEKNLLMLQNNAYMKQLDIIHQSESSLKIARHDMKNHILALQTLIETDKKTMALQYIQNICQLINNKEEYASSGHPEIDSLLNYKISEAKNWDIEVNINLIIPFKLNIQSFDLVVIIGNLFDNAIEAVLKLNRNRKITAFIELDRNVLYITFSNPFQGRLQYNNQELKTTQSDAENHGLGLGSVKKAIEKYNGIMNIVNSDNTFNVDVLLYNPISIA